MSLTPKVNADPSSRISILQSGFRSFVGGVKLPLSSDTKWLLEAICLDKIPSPITPEAPILDQTKYFLEGFLWQHQSNINANRQKWIASMKSNSN